MIDGFSDSQSSTVTVSPQNGIGALNLIENSEIIHISDLLLKSKAATLYDAISAAKQSCANICAPTGVR